MLRRLLAFWGALVFGLVSVVVAASAAQANTTGAATENHTVTVNFLRYSPSDLTVRVGDTVTWQWQGVSPASVSETADGTSCAPREGGFDSGLKAGSGHFFQQTFTTPGDVYYTTSVPSQCLMGMKGRIHVAA